MTLDPSLRRLLPMVLLVLAGQTVAVLDERQRPWILGLSVLSLNIVGVVYSEKAARRTPASATSWRLYGAGLLASASANVALSAGDLTGDVVWWWTGTLMRLSMFVLIASAVLLAAGQHLHGRGRLALVAEMIIVLAAGFMLVWYFALEPIVAAQEPSRVWVSTIGAPLGDLLLVAAVAAVLLRGAVVRLATSTIVLLSGLAVYLVADVTWSAISEDGRQAVDSLFACVTIVLACLLLAASPILAVCRPNRFHQRRTSIPPAWATHLPTAAMAVGCSLILVVTVLERQMTPWGGLVCGLIVTTGAVAFRHMISLRDSRDLIVLDPLTGLANRAGLDQAVELAAKHREPVALLLLDLDGFKIVNDAYGHAAGDTMLAEFAQQVRTALEPGSTAARIGGDEFAVLLPGIGTTTSAVATAERILAAIAAHPVRLDTDDVPVRASIGVALAGPGEPGKELLRRADVAMYHSKRAGHHGCTVFDPSMVDRRAEDAALSDDLDQALDRGELHLLYQPIVDLSDGRPISAEALLRWQHPTRGPVSPVQFIPIAEHSGAITRIGLWVLEQSLIQLRSVQHLLPADRPMHVSVNLSPRQLREPAIVPDILAVLRQTGVDPGRLVLEVTESAIVDENSGVGALRTLREHGVRVAIDDFGTGYSSLQYLTRLPVDILKIDRSFVAELNGTPAGAGVTEAIIRLAHVLHLRTVAEGIETPEQAAELQALGCDTGQGYLFAKPLPAADLMTLLTRVGS